MVSGSFALLYFLLGFHGGKQGSGPDRGPTDRDTYRVACTRLKREYLSLNVLINRVLITHNKAFTRDDECRLKCIMKRSYTNMLLF